MRQIGINTEQKSIDMKLHPAYSRTASENDESRPNRDTQITLERARRYGIRLLLSEELKFADFGSRMGSGAETKWLVLAADGGEQPEAKQLTKQYRALEEASPYSQPDVAATVPLVRQLSKVLARDPDPFGAVCVVAQCFWPSIRRLF